MGIGYTETYLAPPLDCMVCGKPASRLIRTDFNVCSVECEKVAVDATNAFYETKLYNKLNNKIENLQFRLAVERGNFIADKIKEHNKRP